MKKAVKRICAAFLTLSFAALSSCSETVSSEIIVPKDTLKTQPDNSIQIMSGSETAALRSNIDRGFRLETYYTLGSGASWPGGNDNGIEFIDQLLDYYKEESPKEIQVYIYLTEYYDKDLDEKALEQLKTYFQYIRSKGMAMVLRFAYEPSQSSGFAPKQKQMLSHISTLGNWIKENEQLWYDTVTVLQIGLIGAWGEFAESDVHYNRKKVVNALCAVIPENTYIQGRVTDATKLPDEEYQNRIGYHDDFLVGKPHIWNCAGGNNDSKEYKQFASANKYTLNDGEMPWAGATDEPDEYIDGKEFVKQLYEHHLTTLSIEHNYKEFIKEHNQPEEYYNIMRWKSETLTLDDVKNMGAPYYEEYFTDADGKPMTHSIFDYIQDFLGYHLVLSDLEEVSGKQSKINFMITNYGFGAPLNINSAELVVTDKNGNEKIYPIKGFDPTKLTTYSQQTLTAEIDGPLDGCTYGLRLGRSGGYFIQTANSLGYENGVNIIKK